jgi:hypothetical protein
MKKRIAPIRAGLLFSLLALLTGCVSQPSNYSWGRYEQIVYDTYNDPGKAAPERGIEQMEKDLQVARSRNRPVPPGFHAHLGYLYYQVGKADAARQEFETEKAQFPESSVFMNRLLASLQKK